MSPPRPVTARASRIGAGAQVLTLVFTAATVLVPFASEAQEHWGESAQHVAGKGEQLAIHETDEKVTIALGADVLFAFDRADLSDAAEPTLRRVAAISRRYPHGRVLVEGHTDSVGSAQYNLELSRRRADAVKKWLRDRGGITATPIETRGWGMTRPIVPNTKPDGTDDPAGRHRNRRVEVTIFKR